MPTVNHVWGLEQLTSHLWLYPHHVSIQIEFWSNSNAPETGKALKNPGKEQKKTKQCHIQVCFNNVEWFWVTATPSTAPCAICVPECVGWYTYHSRTEEIFGDGGKTNSIRMELFFQHACKGNRSISPPKTMKDLKVWSGLYWVASHFAFCSCWRGARSFLFYQEAHFQTNFFKLLTE